MHRIDRAFVRTVTLAAMTLLAGACSTNLSLDNVTLMPNPEKLARKPDWATFSGGRKDFELRPITAADLVDPEGQCAALASEQASGPADSTVAAGSPQAEPLDRRRDFAADDRVRRRPACGPRRAA